MSGALANGQSHSPLIASPMSINKASDRRDLRSICVRMSKDQAEKEAKNKEFQAALAAGIKLGGNVAKMEAPFLNVIRVAASKTDFFVLMCTARHRTMRSLRRN